MQSTALSLRQFQCFRIPRGLCMRYIEQIFIFWSTDSCLQGPTLFIGGADSDYIPVADHDLIKELFTEAEFQYVSGAGHWVHSQKPKEFLDCLLEFL